MMKRTLKPKKTKPGADSPVLANRLAQAAWHEALTRITSGLVHDTNNCLAGIVSLSEHGVQTAPQSFKEELTLINQSGLKAAAILKKFIQLNPGRDEEPTYYDLNALTTESVDLLRSVLKRKLELDLQLGPSPLPVFLDGLALKKAIICLAFSLADCISSSGKIIFQTSVPTEPAPARVYQGIWPKGPTLCLTLSATTQECVAVQWDDLFEPELTGDPLTDDFRMRFCLIKAMLDQSQGAISITSTPATGDNFQLYLPKANLG